MSDRQCAYCGSSGPLTREHLWPASLHRRLMESNNDPKGLFWLRRANAEIEGEPKLRDVCQACNNGVLSQLDAYVCELFDRSFIHIHQRHAIVRFEYDYHRLKRWLLKMSFNSARVHTSMDLFVYQDLLPYIHGQSLSAGQSVQLYVQLSYPGKVPPENLRDPELAGAPAVWEPQDNRVGLLAFNAEGVGRKVLRAVHLRSFSFFLAFFNPKEKSAVLSHFSKTFLRRMSAMVLLSASRTYAELVCDGMDAWQSFYGSRENAFVSEVKG
jgi:hypothetical protein